MLRNRFKQIRHEHQMNQLEFAAFLEISPNQYNRYENQRQQPTLEGAFQIAEKLNLPLEQLFFIDKQ